MAWFRNGAFCVACALSCAIDFGQHHACDVREEAWNVLYLPWGLQLGVLLCVSAPGALLGEDGRRRAMLRLRFECVRWAAHVTGIALLLRFAGAGAAWACSSSAAMRVAPAWLLPLAIAAASVCARSCADGLVVLCAVLWPDVVDAIARLI